MIRWTAHLKEGPWRRGHAAAVVGNEVYCFGGGHSEGNATQIGVNVFDPASLRWRKLPPPVTAGSGEERRLEVPSRRQDHTAVLVEYAVYLWGGSPRCDVLYAFDVDAHRWSRPQVSGDVPKARYNHSACVLGKVMFIHGGRTHYSGFRDNGANDDYFYKLDTPTMVWSLIDGRATQPYSERHSATIIGTKMFVFGGAYGLRASRVQLGSSLTRYHNWIRVFNTETNHWRDMRSAWNIPDGRWWHSAFTRNGELYIFGGRNDEKDFNDMWKFNPKTSNHSSAWSQVEPKEKGPSRTCSTCCCMVGDRVTFFGGDSDDLYVLDFSPGLKTLCKLAVIQHGLGWSELPHNIRWELAAMHG